MAKVRIGFSTHFEIENELAGIGTDNPTNTKQVLGNIHATNTKAVGVSTLTTFDGFVDTKASISGLEGSEQGSLSGEIIIEGSATVSAGATFSSGPENLTVTDSFTLPGISDDKPTEGTTRFNENLGALEFYTGVEWKAVNYRVDMGNAGRGVFQGGREGPNPFTLIEYMNISSLGNATNFGESTINGIHPRGMSSSIRGLFAGGYAPTPGTIIEYITIASEGNGIDFGDLSEDLAAMATMSSSTRGIVAGGDPGPASTNLIEYVQINTLGNTQDFGDLSQATMRCSGGMNSTRGLILGGNSSAGYGGNMKSNFITMASKGNGTEFGTMSHDRGYQANVSNSVRTLSGGGYHNSISGGLKIIDSIITASLGNAIPFGDLITGRYALSATANQTRAVFVGGTDGTTDNWNVMEFVNFTTSGNAQDFGDLTAGRYGMSGLSDSHGGLGGF